MAKSSSTVRSWSESCGIPTGELTTPAAKAASKARIVLESIVKERGGVRRNGVKCSS